MSLYLVELTEFNDPQAVLAALADQAQHVSAELIEAQVTANKERIFAIIEAETDAVVAAAAQQVAATVSAPAQVRLVGAELEEIKKSRPEAGYLVEWDIPAHLDMETYLARKAEKTPLYDQVPEVSFLRTYVREDLAKCLCFYDAPDAQAVEHAREVVSTPIDRLHALGRIEL